MNAKVLARVGIGVGSCLLGGCGDDDVGTTSGGTSGSLEVVTYNGGLAIGFVEAAEARAPEVAKAVAGLSADIVCLQEIWIPEHVDLVKSETAASYPTAIFPAPDAGTVGPAACTEADTTELLTCVQDNGCDVICADDLVNCVLANCASEFTAVPDTCRGCLQANVGNEIDDIVATCQAESTEFAFGGSFGIGLLAKGEVKAQDEIVFESSTNRRGLIHAEVATEIGTVHAFCTHLTAVFSDIPYPKATGSWAEEQAAQIDRLVQFVDEKAGQGIAVVMGDMNTGPAGEGYIAEVEANYQKFVDAGFRSPYVSTAGNPCTFCADNPIIARGNDDTASVVLDHVFVRGTDAPASGTRVLDGPLEVPGCEGPLQSALSDHYGVSVTIGTP